jgi:hypothetical protein
MQAMNTFEPWTPCNGQTGGPHGGTVYKNMAALSIAICECSPWLMAMGSWARCIRHSMSVLGKEWLRLLRCLLRDAGQLAAGAGHGLTEAKRFLQCDLTVRSHVTLAWPV